MCDAVRVQDALVVLRKQRGHMISTTLPPTNHTSHQRSHLLRACILAQPLMCRSVLDYARLLRRAKSSCMSTRLNTRRICACGFSTVAPAASSAADAHRVKLFIYTGVIVTARYRRRTHYRIQRYASNHTCCPLTSLLCCSTRINSKSACMANRQQGLGTWRKPRTRSMQAKQQST
jgi:hypothetical protein